MNHDEDVNTCREIGDAGVGILTFLIIGLCIAILVWA